MTAPAEDPFELDPHRSTVLLAVGKKGCGKSRLAKRLYRSWPRDKLCIDASGDADPEGAEPVQLEAGELPSRFPVDPDPLDQGRQYKNLRYLPYPGSPTYNDDLDRALALALYPSDNPCLVWCDEWGEHVSASRTPANARTLLMQSRHYGPVSALLCCPRPRHINPLSVSQADLVAIFEVPNPKDRQVLADNMGYPFAELEDAYAGNRTRGQHALLLWDARTSTLYDLPPLPL